MENLIRIQSNVSRCDSMEEIKNYNLWNKTKDRIGLSAKTSCSSHLCLHIFRSYLIADFEELMNVTNALKCMNRNQRIISD